ncbi:773_t:CDS:2 [Diversispora eburnea]|uniref:773_t:CDS:1 n=1 Tax=Diversispora eburnea TaxID=1213867 RepID=A0A9N8YMY9_9GLOM|nr:773_t:CDS:2 [Diversispora eburnea]
MSLNATNPFENIIKVKGPNRSDYEAYSSKCFFSYPPNGTRFQTGYLGIGPSIVSGRFHLRYPKNRSINISKITLSLKGGESFSYSKLDSVQTVNNNFFESNIVLWSSADLRFTFKLDDDLPPSFIYNNIANNVSTCGVIYMFEAIIYNNTGVHKVIRCICPITRWSLPNLVKQPELLTRPKYNNRRWNNLTNFGGGNGSEIENIIYHAKLENKTFNMGSTLNLLVSLILPPTFTSSIKEVRLGIKEYQILQEAGYNIHLSKYKVANNVHKGKEFIKKLIIDEKDGKIKEIRYLLDLELEIPKYDIMPDFDNTRELNHANLEHQLKVRIKFGRFKSLILKGEILIKKSLSEKKLDEAIKNGMIYNKT